MPQLELIRIKQNNLFISELKTKYVCELMKANIRIALFQAIQEGKDTLTTLKTVADVIRK